MLLATEVDMLANNVNSFMMTWTSLLLGAACLWTSCSHRIGSHSTGEAAQKAPRIVPSNLLSFHLQSLGRTPAREEREVIEAALSLMQGYKIRTDSPLRSIRYDAKAREWKLEFDDRTLDGAFTIFMRDKSAEWLDMLHTKLASRRVRFSPKTSGASRE